MFFDPHDIRCTDVFWIYKTGLFGSPCIMRLEDSKNPKGVNEKRSRISILRNEQTVEETRQTMENEPSSFIRHILQKVGKFIIRNVSGNSKKRFADVLSSFNTNTNNFFKR